MFYGDTFAGFKEADEFPAPFEVDRFLYKMKKSLVQKIESFPSPLEVNRFLYKWGAEMNDKGKTVSGPSRGR